MEDLELKQMWQAYDRKLDKLLVLNLRNFEQLQTQKANAKINAFVRNQLVWIIAGILWVASLAFLVLHTLHNLWFAISVGVITLFSAYATIMYIKGVVMIRQIDTGGSITDTQRKLAAIQASLNNTGRILLLQAPFHCTWFINDSMLKNPFSIYICLGIAAVFALISIVMYKALAPQNMHRKWVINFQNSFGGKLIVDATGFLEEIEEFKKENGG